MGPQVGLLGLPPAAVQGSIKTGRELSCEAIYALLYRSPRAVGLRRVVPVSRVASVTQDLRFVQDSSAHRRHHRVCRRARWVRKVH
jgi:hypothetical protein